MEMKAKAVLNRSGKKESIIFNDEIFIRVCDAGRWNWLMIFECDNPQGEGRILTVVSKHGHKGLALDARNSYKSYVELAKKNHESESVKTHSYYVPPVNAEYHVVEIERAAKEEVKKYSDIKRWGHIMGSFDYYVEMQIAEARKDDAPDNAIYKSGDKWITTDDITAGATKNDLAALSHIV